MVNQQHSIDCNLPSKNLLRKKESIACSLVFFKFNLIFEFRGYLVFHIIICKKRNVYFKAGRMEWKEWTVKVMCISPFFSCLILCICFFLDCSLLCSISWCYLKEFMRFCFITKWCCIIYNFTMIAHKHSSRHLNVKAKTKCVF